ncbi:hypothetical protein BASA81_002605 [Batrachochytrium salamandrivorans]|nr:hypothetical protein BASA81_002605 [Batrachochytrium salamandrivorans]
MNIRLAQPHETGLVMGLVNAAFMEDAFFKLPQHAQRIHAVEEICGMEFLVCELRDNDSDGEERVVLVGNTSHRPPPSSFTTPAFYCPSMQPR